MSLSSGNRNVSTALLSKLTPECNNLGRSVKTSATLILVMIVIALVLLIAAIIYSYVKKLHTTDASQMEAEEENKKKVVGILSITSSIVLAITTFVAIWQFNIAAKTVKICMST